MATIDKTMKTFNVPNGDDIIRYEIVDAAERERMDALQAGMNKIGLCVYNEAIYVNPDGNVVRNN